MACSDPWLLLPYTAFPRTVSQSDTAFPLSFPPREGGPDPVSHHPDSWSLRLVKLNRQSQKRKKDSTLANPVSDGGDGWVDGILTSADGHAQRGVLRETQEAGEWGTEH